MLRSLLVWVLLAPSGASPSRASALALQAPPETVLLPPEEFGALLKTARKKMEEYARRIRDGEIAVRPEDTDLCRKGGCEFYDLCRVEKWQFRKS